MRPTGFNFILAHSFAISAGTGALVAVGIASMVFYEGGALIRDVAVLPWTIAAILVSAALGWYVGAVFLWQVLGRIAGRLQGAPFAIGDRICILSGEHRGLQSKVYEVWEERGQVRVDLGAEAKEDVKDVFCVVAVCRNRSTEPGATDNPDSAQSQAGKSSSN